MYQVRTGQVRLQMLDTTEVSFSSILHVHQGSVKGSAPWLPHSRTYFHGTVAFGALIVTVVEEKRFWRFLNQCLSVPV